MPAGVGAQHLGAIRGYHPRSQPPTLMLYVFATALAPDVKTSIVSGDVGAEVEAAIRWVRRRADRFRSGVHPGVHPPLAASLRHNRYLRHSVEGPPAKMSMCRRAWAVVGGSGSGGITSGPAGVTGFCAGYIRGYNPRSPPSATIDVIATTLIARPPRRQSFRRAWAGFGASGVAVFCLAQRASPGFVPGISGGTTPTHLRLPPQSTSSPQQ